MQDTNLKALCPNNAAFNPSVNQSPTSLSNVASADSPSLSLFEEGLRVRLELFALDAQIPLDHYQNNDLETVHEQLELQMNQLGFLLNEVRWLQWLREVKS